MFGLEKSVVTAIGAGLLALALIGAIIGLIKYGQKLGKMEAENTRLEQEVDEANAWKADLLTRLEGVDTSMAATASAIENADARYAELVMRPPHIVTSWREVAADVPDTIPLGNCDRAATNAWDVLKEAGLIGAPTWEDTFYSPPSVQDVLDAVALEQSLMAPSFNLYLSSYPNHPPNVYAGTYQLSTRPLSLENR
jgi:hypothetical protein